MGIVAKLFFAIFLCITGLVGAMMVGFSGDSGANPLFIYLAISWLAYVVCGLIILFSPVGKQLDSESDFMANVIWAFILLFLQPFVVMAIIAIVNKVAA